MISNIFDTFPKIKNSFNSKSATYSDFEGLAQNKFTTLGKISLNLVVAILVDDDYLSLLNLLSGFLIPFFGVIFPGF